MNRSTWIVLAALVVVCVAVLLLPVVLVEPDDYDWYAGMISFSRGHFVSSEEEVWEIQDEMAERFGRGEFHAPIVRNEKGFVHERSPGYYGLQGLFYLVGLNRCTNIFLAIACVLFFFHLVRKYADGKLALVASLLMIFNPTFLTGLYRVYMSDFAYFVFGLFGMGVYWMAREKGKSWLYAVAGLLLSVSVIFRITNVIFFVSIALYELIILIFPKRLASTEGEGPNLSVFAPRCLIPLLLGLIIGIIPLLLYNKQTMGSIFATGYSSRFSHEGWKYVSLFGEHAIFSLRNLSYTVPVGFPRLLQGYPIVLLAPAGFFLMGRSRRRFALFVGLWFATYWATYLCYSTIREDSFQFMCRKFLPSLPAMSIGGAAVLQAMRSRWRMLGMATIAIFGIAVASEFMVRFVVPQPFGKPPLPGRMRGPFGPVARPEIPPDVRMRVELLHRLMDEAGRHGVDTPAAMMLDELARREIERGRFGEAVEFLNAGIEALGGTPPPEPVDRPAFPPREPRPGPFRGRTGPGREAPRRPF